MTGRPSRRQLFGYAGAAAAGAAVSGSARESGLIFLSYQADVAGQFLPLLARLDAADALNEWTTTIGSAVFALPPGFTEGNWLAQSLLG